MIDVINLQRKIKLDTDALRKYVQQLSSSVEEASEKTFSVAFVSDKRMIELNKFFRGKTRRQMYFRFPTCQNRPRYRASVPLTLLTSVTG